MNRIERAIAKASGRREVAPGDVVDIEASLLVFHDGTGQSVLDSFSYPSVRFPERVLATMDHWLPAPTPEARLGHLRLAQFARKHGISLYKRGEGVLHQVIIEERTPRPGQIIAGADGHVATAGAFGALGFSLKPAELARAMHDGTFQVTVPEVFSVLVDGPLPPDITGRDLALVILGQVGAGGLRGKALMVGGEVLKEMPVEERIGLANMFGETGALTGCIVPPGELPKEPSLVLGERDVFRAVAVPGDPGKVVPLSEVGRPEITQVVIGSCSSGRARDLRTAAAVLGGQRVADGVTLYIVPASRRVLEELEKDGTLGALRRSGAIILLPGCGPCGGTHAGVLSDEDRVVSTTVRNTPGRMGAKGAGIYLSSVSVAASAAVKGYLG